MPSESHQTLLLLFRRHPDLAVDLARRAGALLAADHHQLAEFATEAEDPANLESPLHSDRVITGQVDGRCVDAVVIEVQLARDLSKAASLLLYVGSVWRELGCHTWVLLFSPVRSVIDWARRDLYPRRPELVPLLVTHDLIPPITTLESAHADIARAVLSTVLHGRDSVGRDCAKVTIEALLEQRPPDYERYIRLVLSSLPEDDMQRARATLPQEIEYEVDDWEREGSSFQRGLKEGRQEGRQEGREAGRQEGRRALRRAVFDILHARGLEPTEAVAARVHACEELQALVALVQRAATVTTLDQL